MWRWRANFAVWSQSLRNLRLSAGRFPRRRWRGRTRVRRSRSTKLPSTPTRRGVQKRAVDCSRWRIGSTRAITAPWHFAPSAELRRSLTLLLNGYLRRAGRRYDSPGTASAADRLGALVFQAPAGEVRNRCRERAVMRRCRYSGFRARRKRNLRLRRPGLVRARSRGSRGVPHDQFPRVSKDCPLQGLASGWPLGRFSRGQARGVPPQRPSSRNRF